MLMLQLFKEGMRLTMTINVMNKYIEIMRKQINAYMKLVFGRKFNKKYCDIYTEKYINIRYYNYYETDINNTIRKKIVYYIKQEQEELIINNITDRILIEQMCMFYYYFMYFDNVVNYRDLRKTIEKIGKLRKKILNRVDENFEKELYNTMQEYMKEKQDFIEQFESTEFFIKISNYPDKLNVYRINLKNNIKFPLVYSEFAIKKAFEIGTVNEDKLIVEYYLTSIQILKDIIKQNFKKIYIVEFASTLLKKPKKLKSLLNIIDNSALQEKICIKIRYENFIQNKEKIYELMQNGYNIALILDNSFEVNFKNIENLRLFKYIILNKNLKNYEEIKSKHIKNIIII